jgi:ligand-binding sensor domain-containing protein/signal transduction histidine kinase
MKKRLSVWLLLLLCCFAQQAYMQKSSTYAYKQDIYARFQNFTTRDGLSSNAVLGVLQDRYGVLWIATMDGLNRFDGYHFTVYRHRQNDKNSLSNNFITCLAEDTEGNLWIGTQNGLNRLDRKTNTFSVWMHQSRQPQSITNNYIKALLADKAGYLWIETKGSLLDRVKLRSNEWIHIPHVSGTFEGDYYYHHILKDAHNNVWIGGRCFHPMLIKNSDPARIIQNIQSDTQHNFDVNCFVETRDGRFIGGSYERNLVCYNPKTTRFDVMPGIMLPAYPCDAVLDDEGRIWFGGYKGVACVDLTARTCTCFENQPLNDQSLVSNTVYAVYKDRKGNLWFGTDKGLSLYSKQLNIFRYYRQLPGSGAGMASNHISALMQDKDGLLWVGTEENGTDTVSLRTEQFGNVQYSLLRHNIDAITFAREKEILKYYHARNLIRSNNPYESSEKLFSGYNAYINSPLTFAPVNENKVTALYQDSRGYVYIAIYSGTGFDRYDKRSHTMKRYTLKGRGAPGSFPLFTETPVGGNWFVDFLEDSRNRFWCVTWESLGLNLFDRDKGEFSPKHFMPVDKPRSALASFFYDTARKRLWMCGYTYFGYYDAKAGTFHRYGIRLPFNTPDYDIMSGYYRYMNVQFADLPPDFDSHVLVPDNKGNVWIGTRQGIVKFTIATAAAQTLLQRSGGGALISDSITALLHDDTSETLLAACARGVERISETTGRLLPLSPAFNLPGVKALAFDGNRLWIGGAGLWMSERNVHTCQPADRRMFRQSFPEKITHLLADGRGNLWIGCRQGIIHCYAGKEISRYLFGYPGNGSLPGTRINCLYADKTGEIWVATDNGLANVVPQKHKVYVYQSDPAIRSAIISNDVYAVAEDENHNLYVSTDKGLCLLDRHKGVFIDMSEPGNNSITSRLASRILEDRHGNIWLGTTEDGLNVIEAGTEKITHFISHVWDKDGLAGNNVRALFEDKAGRIWIGTDKGLDLFVNASRKFIHYTTDKGLPGNQIAGILQDKQNNLWIATDKGLCRMNPSTGEIRNFYIYNGLQDNAFSQACCVLHDGRLAFGGNYGFNVFDPVGLSGKWQSASVFLLNFRSNGTMLYPDMGDRKNIWLDYADNSFSIDFASTDYAFSKSIRYRYRLMHFDREWIYTDAATRVANYTNLPPGDYLLEVEGSNPFGEWNGTPVKLVIHINTPWYFSLWFIILLVATIILTVVAIIHFRERHLRQVKIRLEELVRKRTADLLDANRRLSDSEEMLRKTVASKDKFFSIISHDLRNPSRSLSQLSELLSKRFDSMDKKQASELIRLLSDTARQNNRLIENLLYWAVYQNGMPVRATEFDLSEAIDGAIAPLKADAGLKNITIEYEARHRHTVFADRNMIETVIRNLVSNAVKFSEQGTGVSVSTFETAGQVGVAVTDEGTGMNPDEVEKLFQIDSKLKKEGTLGEQGTGLGLILCAEFIRKNNGTICVDSIKGQGSTFTFVLPSVASHSRNTNQ